MFDPLYAHNVIWWMVLSKKKLNFKTEGLCFKSSFNNNYKLLGQKVSQGSVFSSVKSQWQQPINKYFPAPISVDFCGPGLMLWARDTASKEQNLPLDSRNLFFPKPSLFLQDGCEDQMRSFVIIHLKKYWMSTHYDLGIVLCTGDL